MSEVTKPPFYVVAKLKSYNSKMSRGIAFGGFTCRHPLHEYNVHIDITPDNHLIINAASGEDIDNGEHCSNPDSTVYAVVDVNHFRAYTSRNRSGSGLVCGPINFRRNGEEFKMCSIKFSDEGQKVGMNIRVYGSLKTGNFIDRKIYLPQHCSLAINNINLNPIINELNETARYY